MYEKKLNGILADEMGLGKTIQTIALLAHLACEKGNSLIMFLYYLDNAGQNSKRLWTRTLSLDECVDYLVHSYFYQLRNMVKSFVLSGVGDVMHSFHYILLVSSAFL